MPNKAFATLAIIGLGAIAILVINEVAPLFFPTVFFLGSVAVFIICIVAFRKTPNTGQGLLAIAGIIASLFAGAQSLKILAENKSWIPVVFFAGIEFVFLIALILMLVKLGKWIYNTIKSRNQHIDE